jgi:hypothetical protein
LRRTIARTLLGESFRDFAAQLAVRPLLQLFCQIGQFDRAEMLAKSNVQRYATWLPEEEVRPSAERAESGLEVAIFKNEFLGRPTRSDGFENRALQVAWGVLLHDLWVLASKLREHGRSLPQR